MTDLDPMAMSEFYQSENKTGAEATRRTNIDKIRDIVPGQSEK